MYQVLSTWLEVRVGIAVSFWVINREGLPTCPQWALELQNHHHHHFAVHTLPLPIPLSLICHFYRYRGRKKQECREHYFVWKWKKEGRWSRRELRRLLMQRIWQLIGEEDLPIPPTMVAWALLVLFLVFIYIYIHHLFSLH